MSAYNVLVKLFLCAPSEHETYLNDLGLPLYYRFNYQGRPDDLFEAISLSEEALRLRRVGRNSRDISLHSLGVAPLLSLLTNTMMLTTSSELSASSARH